MTKKAVKAGVGKVLGYVRVSTDNQDIENQRYVILEYARKEGLHIDEFVEVVVSSRRTTIERRIDELMERMQAGDMLIVSEISRVGRSVGELANIVDVMVKRGIGLVAIKENIRITKDYHSDPTAVVQVTMFSLMAQLERLYISRRTKESLQAKKAAGMVLGRRKGQLGVSKLDDHRAEILGLLEHRVSKSAIARLFKSSRMNLLNWMESRKIAKELKSRLDGVKLADPAHKAEKRVIEKPKEASKKEGTIQGKGQNRSEPSAVAPVVESKSNPELDAVRAEIQRQLDEKKATGEYIE